MWLRLALLLCLIASIASAASVQWDASVVDAEHGVPDGYRVYYGYAVDQLTTAYDVGAELNFVIPETWDPATYYFGVRAYNASGESGWSTTPEGQTWVSYVKAEPPPVLPPAPATDVQIVWEPIEEPPVMAIAYQTRLVNARSGQFVGSNGWTTGAFTPSNNSLLLVFLSAETNAGSTDVSGSLTITDSASLTWTPRLYHGNSASWSYAGAIWTAPVTTGASMTISVDCAAVDIYNYQIFVVEVTGYNTTTPVGATASNSNFGSDGAQSLTLSGTPDSASLIFGFLWEDFDTDTGGATNVTEGSGWTELKDYNSSYHIQHAQCITGSTSTTVPWQDIKNTSTTVYKSGAFAIEIKAASGGGASAVPVIMRAYRARR